ncbi:MAG: rubrerythrin family protein [Deltaproteobacteria bacterium]|nr:rubrerythrin family protein [Deltaproteobacteria bacterium]
MSNTPIEIIRMALEREKEAVQEYAEFAKTAEDPSIRKMFLFLVEEEKRHVKLLQEEIEKEVYQEM